MIMKRLCHDLHTFVLLQVFLLRFRLRILTISGESRQTDVPKTKKDESCNGRYYYDDNEVVIVFTDTFTADTVALSPGDPTSRLSRPTPRARRATVATP